MGLSKQTPLRTDGRTYLLKEFSHFTHQTLLGLRRHGAIVPIRQKVVPQDRRVSECLNYAIHEACIS